MNAKAYAGVFFSRNLGGFDRPSISTGSSGREPVDLEGFSVSSFSKSGGATVKIRVINTMSDELSPLSEDGRFDVCARIRAGLRIVLLLTAAGDTRGLVGTLESFLPDLITCILVPDFVELLAPNMHSSRSLVTSFASASRKGDEI